MFNQLANDHLQLRYEDVTCLAVKESRFHGSDEEKIILSDPMNSFFS